MSEVEFESDAQRAAGVRDGPTVFAVITKKVFDEAVFVAAAARFLYKMTAEVALRVYRIFSTFSQSKLSLTVSNPVDPETCTSKTEQMFVFRERFEMKGMAILS